MKTLAVNVKVADLPEVKAEFERLGKVVEIVERIMTQHWDMAACPCWVCVDGRAAGCRPTSQYLQRDRPAVRVDETHADRFKVDL